ncbi:MAG: YciK family oxidoreductase [Gammaproteobacteria bacterium]|nr:YciK family oxidoreductase [Gammaproteobacteria bacterium]MDD9894495.1 YciK family oxidoreductase [Gammaproteobacteria bacterium]MDD9958180.1 YciK family oxidoreductase [Gammaproteobacteria bacterium]
MFDYVAPADFLEQKSILITGASDGIGKCCAITFAKYGANLILLGRSLEKLEQVYDEVEAINPGRVSIQPIDFKAAQEDAYATLATSVAENYDCLDGLILNASMLGARNPIEFVPADVWEETMRVNVNSTFLLTKAMLPLLRLSRDARLLFISSSVGRKGRAHWGAYGVSKFAIEGLMQTLAEEMEKTSTVKVNSLNPGGTRTGMRQEAYPAEDPYSLPTPEDLMPVYLYLLSTEAQGIHGQAIDARDFEPGKYFPPPKK